MTDNKIFPPRLFHRFFCWYSKPRLRTHIEGDLLELYRERVTVKGRRKADILFIIDVLLLFRPGIIRTKREYQPVNNYAMLKSYFKIAWRRLIRTKSYSTINISGLAIGMTVTIFIGLWIHDELSFNKYHKNYGDIAQVWSGATDQQSSEIQGGISVQLPLGATLKNNYPQLFRKVLVSLWIADFTLMSENEKFRVKGHFIEGGVLEMLSLKMLKGGYGSLDNPNSIVISQTTARTIFGDEDPISKRLRIDNRMEAEVTGVYEDIPRNNRFSEVQFYAPWALYVSSNDWVKNRLNDWDNRPFNIYVQLNPGVSMESANAVIKDLYQKNMPGDYYKTIERSKPFVQLVPMSTWHLYAEFKNGKPAEGRITFVWLFGIIGFFVLLLACINFINLSTARSEKRAREVGVRKAVGSGKGQLISQFLSESFLVVGFAFVASIGLLMLLRSWFNILSDKEISLPFSNPVFWLMVIGFLLMTGFIAGIYPAFYLSSFKPVRVLKGVLHAGHKATMPRKVLVVVQFTVSLILIIGTGIVYQQIQHARNRPIGYDRSNLLAATITDPAFAGKLDLLRTELINTGVVTATATSSSPVTAIWNTTSGYNWLGKNPEMDAEFAICNVAPDFGKTVNWQLVDGRDFSWEFATDTSDAVIVNEAAVKYMNLKNPVGQTLVDTDEFGNFKRAWTIIGVVKDLLMESPYEPARQTIFYYHPNRMGQLHIKINPTVSAATALPKIKTVFARVAPSAVFDYKFVDQEYAYKFGQEERVGKLSGVFAGLAIFISCLGLFGLASYVAEQRTKEIGIRKVMGASVAGLWQMLSRDFVLLVLIACFIAIPIGYILMEGWLKKYEYRTEIPWWIFLTTIAGAVLITMLTVSYQAIKAAKLNPVKSLRME